MNQNNFGINSTNSCKGVALILLLWHHLYYENPEFGLITYKIALLSEVCVAIFVILSGYGLSESIKHKNEGLLAFYKKRFVSLFSNYWFIAIIFVPLGVFFFHITFQSVFLSHPYAKFLIQMSGLHRFFYSEYGYNPTWWYMSVIIPLTFLFPFIYDLVKKYGLTVLLCFFCLLLPIPKGPNFSVINVWLLPFALGIYLSQNNYIEAASNKIRKFGRLRFILLGLIIILAAISRSNLTILNGTKIDWLFGITVILFVFELTTSFIVFEKFFGFLGKHLFNIFLFHTFIYRFWFSSFIYSFENSILIFVVLLIICLSISLLIEQLKKILYFDYLVAKIFKFEIPPEIEMTFQQVAQADADMHRFHQQSSGDAV